MPLQLSPKMQAFTQEVFPAIIGTNRKDGSVEIVPVWFEQKDGSFWINGGTNRGWFKHLERDPRITLLPEEGLSGAADWPHQDSDRTAARHRRDRWPALRRRRRRSVRWSESSPACQSWSSWGPSGTTARSS